jgi:shikimate dehydrogenase
MRAKGEDVVADKNFLVAGVIGWPIAHSRSPVLHGYWLRHHGITGAYLPLAVRPDRLEAALRGLPALGFAGCNVTIPHKEAALRLMDRLDPAAERIGAVNLVVAQPDGALHGFNTDGEGWIESLRETWPSWQAASGPAVVLGAGGGAHAVVATLAAAGAPEIRLLNRDGGRARALADRIGAPVLVLPWAERAAALAGSALLVNTTSLGMTGQPPLDLPLDALPPEAVVSDIVYVPRETALLAAARRRGNPVAEGLGMLLHQARPSFAAFFGVRPDVTPELRRLIEATL